MQLEDLKQRARERAKALESQPNDGPDLFRKDALVFFARVPEPPVYRRRDDPTRAQSAELVKEGELLLARALCLGDEVRPYADAVEAHLRALLLMAEGKVEAAEPAWQAALGAEREATATMRLWSRTDDRPRAVFDKATGSSRFDPRPEATVLVKLACPGCRKPGDFSFAPQHAMHRFVCMHCAQPFTAYFAETRAVEVYQVGRARRRYVFRVEELTGAQTRVEFIDTTNGELVAARRDLLAFLYAPELVLRGVLNLNSSRVLWLPWGGPCFVATVAFGEGAPQLDVLRRFRDEVLLRTPPGRRFVDWYYREGPALACIVAARPWLQAATRAGLGVVTNVIARVQA